MKNKLLKLLALLSCLLLSVVGIVACGGNGVTGGAKDCVHDTYFFPAREGDCWNEGNIAYWKCMKCDKFFTDKDAKNEIARSEAIYGFKHDANAVLKPAVTATCYQVGHPTYAFCENCNNYVDEKGAIINQDQTPINTLLPHNFVNGVCSNAGCGSHEPSQGLEINNQGYVVGLGDCTDTDIVIPNSYEKDGKLCIVNGVDRYAFDDANAVCKITSVRISKGVGVLKRNAFYNLDTLQTVIIEGAIEFESNAFYECPYINTLELGEGITDLIPTDYPYEQVFSNSGSRIKNLSLPNSFEYSKLSFIDFDELTNATEYAGGIYAGNSTNPYLYLAGAVDNETNVTEIHTSCKIIGDYAFYRDFASHTITDVIPNSVKVIGDFAFTKARFNTDDGIINISANVEYIGDAAFAGTNVGINVDEDNQNYMSNDYSLYSKDQEKLFYACVINQDGSFEVPSSVEEIRAYAFYRDAILTNVTLPNGLNYIGDHAFADCRKVVTINIPSTVEIVGSYAFSINPIIYVERTEDNCEFYSSDWLVDENHGYETNPKVVYNCNNNEVAKDGNIYVATDNYLFTIKDNKAKICAFGAVEPTGSAITLPESVTFKDTSYPVTAVSISIIEKLKCESLTIPDCYEEFADIFDSNENTVQIFNENLKELVLGANLKAIPMFNLTLDAVKYNGTAESWMLKDFIALEYLDRFLKNDTKFYVKDGNGFSELTSVTIPSGSTYSGQFGEVDNISEVIVKYGATFETLGDWYDSEYDAFGRETVFKFEYFEDEIDAELKNEFSWIADENRVMYAYGAQDGSNDTFNYTALAGRVRITGYKGTAETLVIPQYIDDKPVTDFGTVFGGNTTITTLVILARVNEIKTGAFANCTNLSWVYINGSVGNIKAGAFTNLNIATTYSDDQTKEYLTAGIYLGSDAQVTESGWVDKAYPVHDSVAFDVNTGIAFTVDGTNKTIIRYVGTAETLTIPDDKGFTAIRSYAFYKSGLTEVVISSTISEIGDSAFMDSSSLEKVAISASVGMIGADAFKNTALTQAIFTNTSSWALVNATTFTPTIIPSSTLEDQGLAATYLKENLVQGYVMVYGMSLNG